MRSSRAKELGVFERCTFLGWREASDLPDLYAAIDALALPSLFEGFPRVLMEASAMAVPVIATDVKGNREAVEHSRNGLLVPYGDSNVLADAMVQLLASPSMSKSMGEQGGRNRLGAIRSSDWSLSGWSLSMRDCSRERGNGVKSQLVVYSTVCFGFSRKYMLIQGCVSVVENSTAEEVSP